MSLLGILALCVVGYLGGWLIAEIEQWWRMRREVQQLKREIAKAKAELRARREQMPRPQLKVINGGKS